MYKPPKIQTITFFGRVSASSKLTLLSKKITAPYKIKRIRAGFPSGTNRLNLLRYYITQSTDAPTANPPIGTNILLSIGQVDYVTGDDNIVDFEHEIINAEANTYVAVYAENQDVFEHTIETQVTIEFLDED